MPTGVEYSFSPLYSNTTSASTGWNWATITIPSMGSASSTPFYTTSASTTWTSANYYVAPSLGVHDFYVPNYYVPSINFGRQPFMRDNRNEQEEVERPNTNHQEAFRWAREERERAEVQRNATLQAEQVAEALLLEHLTPEQREQYRVAKEFMVISESGKRFLIEKGQIQNVFELDERRRRVKRYCIHPREDFPLGDTLLAQKLMLEGAEREFMRIANMTPLLTNG